MIVEGVDALKGAIRPLSLDCPLIAVTEDNVKDRLLRALGHSYAIPHKNDSLETIQKLLNPRCSLCLNRRVVSAGKRSLAGAALRCL